MKALQWASEVFPRFFEIAPAIMFPNLMKQLANGKKLPLKMSLAPDSKEWAAIDHLFKQTCP